MRNGGPRSEGFSKRSGVRGYDCPISTAKHTEASLRRSRGANTCAGCAMTRVAAARRDSNILHACEIQ